jgi:hypothetical protein
MSRIIFLVVAGSVSLAILAGCSEPTIIDSERTQTDEERAERVEEDRGIEERLRESLQTFGEETGRVAGEARDRLQEVIDDPEPFLEQAREIAGRIGESVDEIVEQAARDLQRGVELLEERIAEMLGEPVVTEDTEARLPPEDQLNADTSAAARAQRVGLEPAYIGVWAANETECGRIDIEAVENFAVITQTTIRRHESLCNFDAEPLAQEEVTLSASCVAEGDMEDRRITLAMPSRDSLAIGYDGMEPAQPLLRCHLPE